jgi:hypothetical protein
MLKENARLFKWSIDMVFALRGKEFLDIMNRRNFLGLAGIALAGALRTSVVLGAEEKKPRWMHCLVEEKDRKTFDNPYDDLIYYINLFGMQTGGGEDDCHGKTHDVNSYLRNYFSRNRIGVTADGWVIFEKFNCFYLLNGDYCLLKEPNLTLEQVREFVPILAATKKPYQLYLVDQVGAFDDRPLYILDELTAFTNGATYAGKFGGDRFRDVLDFITFSVSLGIAVQKKDPNYWKSKNGEDLKDFLKYATRKALYAEASQQGSQAPYDDLRTRLGQMLNKDQSDFLRHEIGWNG